MMVPLALSAVLGQDSRQRPLAESLRAFIKSLHKKIDPNPDHPQHITTGPWVHLSL